MDSTCRNAVVHSVFMGICHPEFPLEGLSYVSLSTQPAFQAFTSVIGGLDWDLHCLGHKNAVLAGHGATRRLEFGVLGFVKSRN